MTSRNARRCRRRRPPPSAGPPAKGTRDAPLLRPRTVAVLWAVSCHVVMSHRMCPQNRVTVHVNDGLGARVASRAGVERGIGGLYRGLRPRSRRVDDDHRDADDESAAGSPATAPGVRSGSPGWRGAGRSGLRGVAGSARGVRDARRCRVPDRDARPVERPGRVVDARFRGSRPRGERNGAGLPPLPDRARLRVGRVELQQHLAHSRARRRRDRRAVGLLRHRAWTAHVVVRRRYVDGRLGRSHRGGAVRGPFRRGARAVRRRRHDAGPTDQRRGARRRGVCGRRDAGRVRLGAERVGPDRATDPPRDAPYELRADAGVASRAFNRDAVRLPTDDAALSRFADGTEVTGELQMPLLTVHTTGDGQVPINQAQILRQRVSAAGQSDRLRQRVIDDPGHCGFTTGEQEAAFDALVDWVERDRKPDGTNLDVDDLSALDHTFELQPRPGDPTDDGASTRTVITGNARLDGAPFDAQWIGAVVRENGLVTPCQAELPPIEAGRYEITVFSADESLGCGRPGSEVLLWTFLRDQQFFVTAPIPWPESDTTVVDVDVALCGVASVRGTGSFDGYILSVVGPDSVPGCRAGATLTFRVDGALATETSINSPEHSEELDLTLG